MCTLTLASLVVRAVRASDCFAERLWEPANMFIARSHIDLHNIRQSVDRIGDISDNVIHLGPIKLGLEAVLEFVPFVGEIYSIVAGGLLIIEGMRARVPGATQEAFDKALFAAKTGCPVSKLYRANITLTSKLES